MAKKQEKEIERWVTVNGARVPIFKDGSIGGPKALRDKVKANQKKKSSTKNFESMNSIELSSIDLKKLSDDEFSKLHKVVKNKYPDKLSLRSRIIEESNRRFFEQSKKEPGTKEKQIVRNKKEADERNGKTKVDKEQATKAITELQMYGKKKNGFPYSKKDAEEAVKSMTPAQIKKLADKRDERRAYQEKLTASSDMSLKKQYKTASFEEKKEIQAEMHSRGYFYRDGKWIDRFKARGYRQWGKGDDWD